MSEATVNQEELQVLRQEEKLEDNEINLLDIFKTLKRRWLPFTLVFGSIVAATAGITISQTPIFQSKGQLLISKTNDASALTGLADQLSLDPLSNQSNPLETEIQVLLSIPILDNVIESLDLKDAENETLTILNFRENLQASAVRGTDVLEVTYKDEDAQLAADIVNAVMQFYLKNDIEVNRSQTRAARQFISQQIPRSERQLSQAESNLRQFKERFGIVELGGEAQESVKRIADLKAAIVNTEAKLLAAKERSQQLQANFGGLQPKQAIAIGRVSESRSIQSTLLESKKLEDQLAVARSTLQSEHPELRELEEKLIAINKNLEGRILQTAGNIELINSENLELGQTIGLELMTELVKADVETKSMQEQLSSLEDEYKISQERTKALPALEQKQAELQRDLEVARQSYNTLLESYQKAQLAENQNLGNARVINQAQKSEEPISPRTMMNMLMGSFLGLLGGAGAALLLEAKDTKIRSIKDVKDFFPYTILGSIPLFEEPKKSNKLLQGTGTQLPMRSNPNSMISETYRMVNTNLKFSRSGKLQVIVITSSVPGEGKSTTLANLALGFADLGSRVLLIDGDLRRPSQHQIWEIPNRLGLSNLLVDSTSPSNLPIIEEEENFHLLSSGAIPPNPTALLDSSRFKSLINQFRDSYDYILIDAPPITAASDALLIARHSDGVLVVARPEVAIKPALHTAYQSLQQTRQNVLGLVVNGVNIKNEESSYYYYSREYYGNASTNQEHIVSNKT